MKREMTVEISSEGFVRTGLKSDVCQVRQFISSTCQVELTVSFTTQVH